MFEETRLHQNEVREWWDILDAWGYHGYWKCSTAEDRKGMDGVVTFVRGNFSAHALQMSINSILGEGCTNQVLAPTQCRFLPDDLGVNHLPPLRHNVYDAAFSLSKNEYFFEHGRTVVVYLDNFVLINVYRPNTQSIQEQYEQRILDDEEMRVAVVALGKKYLVIMGGDFNVTPENADINPLAKTYYKKKSTTSTGNKERHDFHHLCDTGGLRAVSNVAGYVGGMIDECVIVQYR